MNNFRYEGYPSQTIHSSPYLPYIQHTTQYTPQFYHTQAYPETPYEAFAKPKQPEHWPPVGSVEHPSPFSGAKPANHLSAHFQNNEGQVDLDKMIATVSQLANTYHQVSPIIKEFGTLLKNIR
ncbi:YppG family protein [Virgibacillus sediminis]|uniref:YppG family protein n=1 Tax=Virgibacillus sediminis TaxID=202260 RepID=A0ABV7A4P2_9BACI